MFDHLLPRLVTAILAVLLILIASSARAEQPQADQPQGVDILVPGSPVPATESQRLRVYKFWATWCSVCIAEMPKFNQLQHRLGDRVDVIAVNVATEDPKENVLATVEELSMNMPVWYDAEQQMWNGYGLKGTPSYVVVDVDGKPIGTWAGEWPEAMVALLEGHVCDDNTPDSREDQREGHPAP